MNVAKILSNKTILNGLEKISEHGTSFSAGTSLVLSLGLRPLAINKTPNTEKENRQYAMANSIGSGLMKFAIVESIAIPVENAVKKIDKNPTKYLNNETIKNLSPRAYKLITQTIKLSVGLFTAIPKSVLTIALIPIIMDKLFTNNKTKEKILNSPAQSEHNYPQFFVGNPQNFGQKSEQTFTGNFLNKSIAKIIDNKNIQNIATKYQLNDKDVAKHITAGTDILLTSTSVYQTNKSKDIKENRKLALIYNNIISTVITLVGGYCADYLAKNKTGEFIDKFKQLNANDPKLAKYIEGINILRPALIFATIYYGILPMFSTFTAEKIDNYIKKHHNKIQQ